MSFLPTDSKLRKEIPLWTFISGYFPKAIVAMANLSFKANEKHNPGQPMHWSRAKSSDHKDCIPRHLLDEERIDEETGWPEAVAAAWRACANAEIVIERLLARGVKLPCFDPPPVSHGHPITGEPYKSNFEVDLTKFNEQTRLRGLNRYDPTLDGRYEGQ